MGATDKKALHVDADNYPVYDAGDIRYFQSIIGEVLDQYGPYGSLSINKKCNLEVILTVAIFRSAQKGERDYAQLKRSAIEAVSAVTSCDQGS